MLTTSSINLFVNFINCWFIHVGVYLWGCSHCVLNKVNERVLILLSGVSLGGALLGP